MGQSKGIVDHECRKNEQRDRGNKRVEKHKISH